MKTACTAIIAAIAACTAMAATTEDRAAQFAQWAAQHGKTYEGEEAQRRLEVFSANAEAVEEHNAKGLPWTMGLNAFSDLTNEEFTAIYTGGFQGIARSATAAGTGLARRTQGQGSLPASVDWTAAGAVTPVKTQERTMCGSDYAFSAAGAMEGIDFIKNGAPVTSLSVQQIVDCSASFGNVGCYGGTMNSSFQYAQHFGLTHDVDYPYTARNGTCKCHGMAPPCLVRVPITGHNTVPSGSEQELMAAVARQPISVAVSAQSLNFKNYQSGVMTAPCGTHLDTGMLLVGYGTINGQDYWKVKNSWGTSWGEQGYILLGRGPQYGFAGQCGIQMDASYPEIL